MLIFLDIDGVMVPAKSWKRPGILEDGFPEFSPKAIEALTKIISKSSADFVLTTSHKSKYSLSEWKAIFERRNINANSIMRLPENIDFLSRKDELLLWFKNHSISGDFIIIDDDKSLNSLPDHLKARLILTSASVGLTDYQAVEALRVIKKLKHELPY